MRLVSAPRLYSSALVLAWFLNSSNATSLADDKVQIVPDVVYGHKDGMALTYDVFKPTSNANGAALLFMVSGGWYSTWTPPEQFVHTFDQLLERGYTVIAVRHGSSPRYVVPECADDVRKALAFVTKHAGDYSIDPKRIGVFGFSAGGHLSLILGTQTNDNEAENAPRVAAVVAVFPPTDLEPYVKIGNPRREQFPALQFDPKEAPAVSPLLSVTDDDAPTRLFHGDKDDLVPLWHSEKIQAAFKEHNVDTKLTVFEGAGHGFNEAQTAEMMREMIAWFDEHLAP